MSTLKCGIIPPDYKDFYSNIPVNNQLRDYTQDDSEDEEQE